MEIPLQLCQFQLCYPTVYYSFSALTVGGVKVKVTQEITYYT